MMRDASRQGEGWECVSEDLVAKIDRHVDEHLRQYIEDLRALCQLPSVAAQGQAIDDTADLTRTLLEKYGVSATVMPTARFPVVYGEASGASEQTVLCYNHYDVQPAEPLELWDSEPFDAVKVL